MLLIFPSCLRLFDTFPDDNSGLEELRKLIIGFLPFCIGHPCFGHVCEVADHDVLLDTLKLSTSDIELRFDAVAMMLSATLSSLCP